jgi:hypothetical protein
MMQGASFSGRRQAMHSYDVTYLGVIYYEERLRQAEQSRQVRRSEWFRKLPRLAQIAAMILF